MSLDEAITEAMRSCFRGWGFHLNSPTEGRGSVVIDVEYTNQTDWGIGGTSYLIVLTLSLFMNGEMIDQVTLYGDSDEDWCDMDWSHPEFKHKSQSDDWTWSKH